MDCPLCNTPDIELGEGSMQTDSFEAPVYYAICCSDEIRSDPNWGGGYECEFFVLRESKEELVKAITVGNRLRLSERTTEELKRQHLTPITDAMLGWLVQNRIPTIE